MPDIINHNAYMLYRKAGQSAVEEYARNIGIETYAYCQPCESNEPIHEGECLVCGTPNDGSLKRLDPPVTLTTSTTRKGKANAVHQS